MTITECKRKNLCVDCDNLKCSHVGDKVSDCPRLPQFCGIREVIGSCDECTWIDKFINDMRIALEEEKK